MVPPPPGPSSLPDGIDKTFSTTGEIRLTKTGSEHSHCHGLVFTDLSQPLIERLERFLSTLPSWAPTD